MVMQVTVAERIRFHAEAQGRWGLEAVAGVVLSASQRLCARTHSVPAEGRAADIW
jgi:hypothetical protein